MDGHQSYRNPTRRVEFELEVSSIQHRYGRPHGFTIIGITYPTDLIDFSRAMTDSPSLAHPLANRLASLRVDNPLGASSAAAQECAERAALATEATLHALPGDALVRVQGADAPGFLQSQFTNDIGLLGPDNAQWSAYCTPQGRTLAMLLAWKSPSDILLALPCELADGLIARLRRYVLRARVTFDPLDLQQVLLGVGGTGAGSALADICGGAPERTLERLEGKSGETLIRLADDLFLVSTPAAEAPALWDALARRCTPASERAWHWRLVHAGIPRLGLALQDRFVPQMLNLEQLGGISFDKGCYPGQEVVARAKYLGQVKRHLANLHAAQGPFTPGQALLRAEGGNAGTVVCAAPAPKGGWDVLAVLVDDAIGDPGLRAEGAGCALVPLD